VREQKRATTSPCGGKGGLGPGVAAADHDYIEGGGKLHRSGQENRPNTIEF